MTIKTGILESVKSDIEGINDNLENISDELESGNLDVAKTNSKMFSVFQEMTLLFKKIETHLSTMTGDDLMDGDVNDN